MTIQTVFWDGEKEVSRIYRKVYVGKNFAQYVESFFAQRDIYRWGKLIQLKGKDRLLMRSFGKLSNGETVCHIDHKEN